MSDFITVITASSPVNKRFVEHPDGSVEKIGTATLVSGVAQSVHVPDADALAKVLREVANGHNKVIVPGRWRGDEGSPFKIVTKRALADRLGTVALDAGPARHRRRALAPRTQAQPLRCAVDCRHPVLAGGVER